MIERDDMPALIIEGDPYLVCIEGLAGSGKSTIISSLLSEFSSKEIPCDAFKLGGLGNSRRGNILKEIRAFRQSIYNSGDETQKQIKDRLQGRIYQAALTAQTRELKDRMGSSKVQLYLLDRSPFMNSVHLKAEAQVARKHPYVQYSSYADEVFKRELALAKSIGIKHIVLLDISSELSFARMIIRYCGNDEGDIVQAISKIKASPQRQQRIYEQVCKLKANLRHITKEPMDNWHLATQIEVADAEREMLITTIEAVCHTTEIIGDIVDANQDKDIVLQNVKKSIEEGIIRDKLDFY